MSFRKPLQEMTVLFPKSFENRRLGRHFPTELTPFLITAFPTRVLPALGHPKVDSDLARTQRNIVPETQNSSRTIRKILFPTRLDPGHRKCLATGRNRNFARGVPKVWSLHENNGLRPENWRYLLLLPNHAFSPNLSYIPDTCRVLQPL